jgi:Skp family chaperone for outer membrane proteins
MKRWTYVAVAAVVAISGATMVISSTANAQGSKAVAPVAVVDLDAVAKAVGRDVVIRQQVEVATQQLNQQLVKAATDMKTQIEAEQAKLTDASPEDDKKRVAAMLAQANQNVQNNKAMAQLRQQQIRNELIVQFRDEIRPMAEKAARAQGAMAVLVTAETTVLWFDPALDITDEVIAEYRSNPPKPALLPNAPLPDDKATIDAPAEKK